MDARLLIVDGSNIVMRAAFGGEIASKIAIPIATGVIERATREWEATHMVIAMDTVKVLAGFEPAPSWRRDLYPAYKANRKIDTSNWLAEANAAWCRQGCSNPPPPRPRPIPIRWMKSSGRPSCSRCALIASALTPPMEAIRLATFARFPRIPGAKNEVQTGRIIWKFRVETLEIIFAHNQQPCRVARISTRLISSVLRLGHRHFSAPSSPAVGFVRWPSPRQSGDGQPAWSFRVGREEFSWHLRHFLCAEKSKEAAVNMRVTVDSPLCGGDIEISVGPTQRGICPRPLRAVKDAPMASEFFVLFFGHKILADITRSASGLRARKLIRVSPHRLHTIIIRAIVFSATIARMEIIANIVACGIVRPANGSDRHVYQPGIFAGNIMCLTGSHDTRTINRIGIFAEREVIANGQADCILSRDFVGLLHNFVSVFSASRIRRVGCNLLLRDQFTRFFIFVNTLLSIILCQQKPMITLPAAARYGDRAAKPEGRAANLHGNRHPTPP